jgi:hypothetical protein
MRRKVSLTVFLFVVLLAAVPMASADVPHQMNYQGQLTDEGGTPLDTIISMTFTIYSDSSGGMVVWTETQTDVEVSGGLFYVILGSEIPIPDTVFADDWRWLGITVGDDPEITPRTKLVTVPYAFQSLRVATVDGATGGDVYGNLRLHSHLYVGGFEGEAGYLHISDGSTNTIVAYGSTGGLNMEGDLDISGKATLGFGNTNTGADAFVAGRINEVSGDYATVGGGLGNSATGLRSTVGGGMWNLAGAVHATVAGGHSDTVDASGGTIGGGTENRVADDYGTISGGINNTVSGSYSTVGGGRNNSASLSMVTVGGGQFNTASGDGSTIAGGMQNAASGTNSTIGGGSADTASGHSSIIAGGRQNTASGDNGTIGGGYQNTAGGDSTTISGGSRNSATGNNSAIGGGTGNEASFISLGPPMDPLGGWSTVGGGRDNRALGDYSTISGGRNNTAAAGWTATDGGYSTVAGGQDNHAFAMHSTVSGGQIDSALAPFATVGGGYMNTAGAGLLANPDSGEAATVAGGYGNRATGHYSTIGGGSQNAADRHSSTVGGGYQNFASNDVATISGGQKNLASGTGSSVGGGYADTATSNYSTVGGGVQNKAAASYATVGGGEKNKAEDNGTTIAGGCENSASDVYGTVGGGRRNSNAGQYSVIPGGRQDTLTSSADYSMAFGYAVYVNNPYRVVFFDSVNSGRLGINRDDHNAGGIAYPIHVGTDGTNGNGAYLTSGGTWTNGSSRTFKENFQKLESQELLRKISSMPVEAWQYKNTDERHIGPVSEDFVSAFNVGTVAADGSRDNKYLSPGDVAGVALAGVKELIRENEELKQMIGELNRKIAELEKAQASKGGK